YKNFINRHVDDNYNVRDYKQDMRIIIEGCGLKESETVAMMTAVNLDRGGIVEVNVTDYSLLIVVTEGVGNVVDDYIGERYAFELLTSTINTWIFVSGKLTEEEFLQAIVTATEAKTIALRELGVLDQQTNTIATGTSTDSILVAATQTGKEL